MSVSSNGRATMPDLPTDPDLTFDRNDFRATGRHKTGVTFKTKNILMKDPANRTKAELAALMVRFFW